MWRWAWAGRIPAGIGWRLFEKKDLNKQGAGEEAFPRTLRLLTNLKWEVWRAAALQVYSESVGGML